MIGTERAIREICLESLPVVLVITKLDRLICELKLPPQDAYFKLLHVIHECNELLARFGFEGKRFSPESGNVAFASGLHGWVFTLESWAHHYRQLSIAATASAKSPQHSEPSQLPTSFRSTNDGSAPDSNGRISGDFDVKKFAKKLWGNQFFDPETRKFVKQSRQLQRSFIHFIMEPVHKIYAALLGLEGRELQGVLRSVGVVSLIFVLEFRNSLSCLFLIRFVVLLRRASLLISSSSIFAR